MRGRQKRKTPREYGVDKDEPITYGVGKDEQLPVWLLNTCDKQLPITTQILKAKARELISQDHPQFKASDEWGAKIKQCHKLVLRMKTSLAQELPAILEEKVRAFHSLYELQALRKGI